MIVTTMRKCILVLFLLASTLACKEEKKAASNSSQHKQKESLSFNLDAIIENNGIFTLFFLEEGQENISIKNSRILEVKGSLEPQILTFTINEDVIPDKLFLRFVNEEKKQVIDIRSATISFGDKSIIIKDSLFYQYFMPNKFVEYDNKNFRATTKEVDGKYLPRFGSRDLLLQKMLLEF